MRADTERLEFYVRYCLHCDDALTTREQADSMMAVTAFGEPTYHDMWYWPLDEDNHEFKSFREAIDWKMDGGK